ncbi:TetR/AcrR family transcriptional regulator [Aquipuribacter hungaricus]|uniref:TetR/AcrR family transcriptional regulator n=1 Tax=Aquipuribacter hungaricus TaxID=545624 RepID=A0ABV7WKM2_9MICO
MTVADGIPAVRGRSPRAVRPSPEQLDAAILDAAAEVFARHGFAGTSVQQVADTVGYSKTGLLRRFPSKQALYDGVLGHVSACVEGILDGPGAGQGLGDGDLAPPRTRAAVLRAVTAAAFQNPGTVVLVLEALRPGSDLPGTDQVEQTTLRLAGQLTAGIDDPQDRLRALLALQLVATAATLALDPGAHVPELSVSQVHDVALQAAGDVVGVRTT